MKLFTKPRISSGSIIRDAASMMASDNPRSKTFYKNRIIWYVVIALAVWFIWKQLGG